MKNTFFAFSLLLLLTACGLDTDIEMQTANHIARPAFMVERGISAGNFTLNAWERMHEERQPATIYIEGDGIPMKSIDNNKLSWNPTPKNPVGLHLASRDKSTNLAYLARPCQYVKMPAEKGCDVSYWKERRYTPEVMSAYQAALNDIVARYDIEGLHLVGYGGGANIAAVLAAIRNDVLSLRTVAGNVSPTYTEDYHDAAPLATDSVFATDFGTELAVIPQHHFIGAVDTIIPPGTYHSYRQSLGLSDCINYSVVQDADHTRGWVQRWPQLLAMTPECAVVHEELPPLPPAQEFPGDYGKGKR